MTLSRRAFSVALGLTLSLGTHDAFARRSEPTPPPAPSGGLIDNINGLTTDQQGRLLRFSGLVIDDDGRVVRRLSAGETRPAYPSFRLDGKGRTLVPSLVDAHVSLADFGLALLTLDLTRTQNLAEAQAKIASLVKENPDRKWILGRGWDANRWGLGRNPTAADLDTLTGAIPTFLLNADGELGWANSAALRAAGLAKVTGALTPAQTQQLRRAAPAPSPKDRDAAFQKAQSALLASGIGTVSAIGMTIDDWQSYRRAGDKGTLRIRIIGYANGIDQMVAIAGPEPTPWLYDDRLRMAGVSFTLDGTVAAHSAWMKQPPQGAARISSTALRNQMSRAAMDGFQITLTAHGDAAVDEALGAFEEMAATYKGDRRWRIDGMEVIAPADAVRFTSGNVTPVLTANSLSEPSITPLRENSPMALATSPSPFGIIGRMMAQSGDFGAALVAATRAGAKASFAETKTGTLEPGSRADFLLIDKDISTVTPQDIATTKVLEHWIGGRRAYVNADAQ